MAETRKRLKISTPLEVRRALSRISNLVLNHELDTKSANTIIYACNIILSTFKTLDIIEGGGTQVKSNRQFAIQQLLRAAEITGDSTKREQYLEAADKLIQREISKEAREIGEKNGIVFEELKPAADQKSAS